MHIRRATLAEELQLFVAIDTGVRASANSEMPASLLPRVRVKLNELSVPRRSWIPTYVAVTAAVALVTAIVFVRGAGRGTAEQGSQMTAGAPDVLPPETKTVLAAVLTLKRVRRHRSIGQPSPSNSDRITCLNVALADREKRPSGRIARQCSARRVTAMFCLLEAEAPCGIAGFTAESHPLEVSTGNASAEPHRNEKTPIGRELKRAIQKKTILW